LIVFEMLTCISYYTVVVLGEQTSVQIEKLDSSKFLLANISTVSLC